MSTFGSLHRRLGRLEAMQPENDHEMPFLWFHGQSLDDALDAAGLSLDDGPLFAIEIMGVTAKNVEPVCPLHERDRPTFRARDIWRA